MDNSYYSNSKIRANSDQFSSITLEVLLLSMKIGINWRLSTFHSDDTWKWQSTKKPLIYWKWQRNNLKGKYWMISYLKKRVNIKFWYPLVPKGIVLMKMLCPILKFEAQSHYVNTTVPLQPPYGSNGPRPIDISWV